MAQGILSIKIRADASPLERALKIAGRDMAAFSQKALAIGRGITLGFTAPVVAMGSSFLNAAASMDQLERGMAAIMGSSSDAAKELNKLKESAKLPGLAFEEAVRGSIRLQSVGLQADQARKVLETFGKAIATTGGGAVELEAVQYQMTQMISKNKILAEDFKPIQSAVPLIGKAMQQAFGTDNIEGVRALGISAKDFTMRLTESLRVLPEVQNSTGGVRNSFDNLKDSIKFASAEMGKVILKNIDLDAIIADVVGSLTKLTEWFGGLSEGQQKLILNTTKNIAIFGSLAWIVGQLGSAFGTLTYVMGQAVGSLIDFDKGLNKISLTTNGYIALAVLLVGAIYAIYDGVKKASEPLNTFNQYLSVGAKNARQETAEFNFLMNTLKDVNISSSTRKQILEDLNTKYSEYLPKLITEKTSLQEINAAQKDGNESLKTKFRLLAQQGVAEKQLKKIIELEDKLAVLEKNRSGRKIATSTGLTTGLNLGAGTVQYDTESANINKLKEDLKALTNAYDNTNKSIAKLTEEQIKNKKIIDDKKIRQLEYQIEDLNLAIEVSNREYGKNNVNVKRLKEELSALESQYQSLKGEVDNNNDTLLNNGIIVDKVLGPYDLLKNKLSDVEDAYRNILVTQGINSKSAQNLRDKYYELAGQLKKINDEYDKLENRKIDTTPLGQYDNKETEFGDIFTTDIVKRLQNIGNVGFKNSNQVTGFFEGLTKSTKELGKTSDEVAEKVAKQPKLIAESVSKAKLILEDFELSLSTIGEALNENFGRSIGEGFDALGTALANGENAIASFGKAFIDSMLDVISMTLKALLAQITLKEAIKGGGLGSVIGLGIGLATVSALKGLLAKTKLAKGGLAFGPTMATVGDNPNASFDPEVIAPLSKLKSMLGDVSGGMPYVLSTRVSGADLIVVMERANNINQRIR
jgi:tape measure domain-containing protein